MQRGAPGRPSIHVHLPGRGLVALHGVFVAAFGAVALLGAPARGWAVLACVAAYDLALPLTARRAGRPELVALASFLLAVSAFQLLPDWVLAGSVGTLRFPDGGGLRADDVIPLAMCGMWVAPLFVTVVLAAGDAVRAAALALAIFAGSELLAPALRLWKPVGDVHEVAGVALYVLPAEAVLGAATLLAWRAVAARGPAERVGAALGVSTLYLGALVLAHFLIDVAGWRITT